MGQDDDRYASRSTPVNRYPVPQRPQERWQDNSNSRWATTTSNQSHRSTRRRSPSPPPSSKRYRSRSRSPQRRSRRDSQSSPRDSSNYYDDRTRSRDPESTHRKSRRSRKSDESSKSKGKEREQDHSHHHHDTGYTPRHSSPPLPTPLPPPPPPTESQPPPPISGPSSPRPSPRATPPTGPRSFAPPIARDRVTIAPTTIPTGPKISNTTFRSTVPTGPRSTNAIRKFFPGEDSEEDPASSTPTDDRFGRRDSEQIDRRPLPTDGRGAWTRYEEQRQQNQQQQQHQQQQWQTRGRNSYDQAQPSMVPQQSRYSAHQAVEQQQNSGWSNRQQQHQQWNSHTGQAATHESRPPTHATVGDYVARGALQTARSAMDLQIVHPPPSQDYSAESRLDHPPSEKFSPHHYTLDDTTTDKAVGTAKNVDILPPIQAPTPAPEPLPTPVVSTEVYERIVQVGEGTYGKVYKAKNLETGALVALKRIRMEAEKDGFPVTAIREIKLLQSLRHPNVVDLIEMMVSKGHVYMVFEYMGHDLTGILHHPSIHFTPAHLKSLMQQLLEGLGFIHRRGVLHRDLKGSNLLVSTKGELKIADFGLARFYARDRGNDYTNRVITQWYKPPELLFGATVYGSEVDMWSAGCIFLELFARRPVFQGQDEIHQLEVIFKTTGTPTIENWPTLQDLPWYELVKPTKVVASRLHDVYSKWISPAGLDVADKLLLLDPAGRPDSETILQMPYFTTEEPLAQLPDILSTVKGEWHEYESKRARKKKKEEAGAAL